MYQHLSVQNTRSSSSALTTSYSGRSKPHPMPAGPKCSVSLYWFQIGRIAVPLKPPERVKGLVCWGSVRQSTSQCRTLRSGAVTSPVFRSICSPSIVLPLHERELVLDVGRKVRTRRGRGQQPLVHRLGHIAVRVDRA